MGLILIVICGGELFTSSVLSSISWANREISFGKMLSIWGKVYVGNFIGAIFLLLLVTAAGLYQLDEGQWGLNALNIAQHKLHHTTVQAFALGILCNLLVCLAIWLTFSSANAMTKAAMTIMPVAMFVSSGFEHCVANMFMVPLGIVIQNFAPDSFWQQVGVTASQYSDLNVTQFITANLIPNHARQHCGWCRAGWPRQLEHLPPPSVKSRQCCHDYGNSSTYVSQGNSYEKHNYSKRYDELSTCYSQR